MLSRSNSAANNSAPSATTNLPSATDYGSYDSNPYYSNYGQIVPFGSQFSRTNTNSTGSFDEPRSFGRRTSSFGSARFPPQHRSPVQIVILEPQPAQGEASPGWVQSRRGPLMRSAAEHQNKAVESLRKEFYNPRTKRITNTINLYYRDTPVNPREVAGDGEDGGKRCAVCLEDFERGQEVTLTPCNHMFHGECIVPWAKTNPQCPVCRFVLGPKVHEPSSAPLPFNYYNGRARAADMAGPGLTTQEFLSIIRALGDGFQL